MLERMKELVEAVESISVETVLFLLLFGDLSIVVVLCLNIFDRYSFIPNLCLCLTL